ncbi:MAG TPA: (2Fe-2S)-binding protein [Candidatus Dormibacteraeota bacterium]|nr:(2Fe-2S)-binding protein [Candidatus Dormibacteraeota bacterium]
MTKRDDPKNSEKQKKEEKTRALGRRDFVKLVGSTTAAISAGVLGSAGVLTEEASASVASAEGIIGPGAVPIVLRINGEKKSLTVEPRVTLLDALRDRLDLTGAKKVCDRGTCGACTVIVNNKAVYSCTTLAIDVAENIGSGADIRTIESLAPEGQLHPVSAAFVDNDAQQCGFCTPGFVMACKAYLDQHPHPTYEEVQHALGGNLCRCGTYMGVRHATVEAANKMRRGA